MKAFITTILIIALILLMLDCSEKVNQPTDLPEPGSINPDTTYVMITPAWTEADGITFDRPTDVMIGYDRFVYVADRNNDRVVKLTLAGEFVESYQIPNPTQIDQDRALDLLAVNDSSVVLRRSFREGGDFQVVYTAPDVPRPPPIDDTTYAVLFGIAASPFPDKTYSISNFYLNEIYRFDSGDEYVDVQVPSGNAAGRVAAPVAVNSFNIRGQYYIGYTSGRSSFAVQLIEASTGQPVIPFSDSADIYLTTVNGHKDIAVDDLGNIFVTMAAASEVWKFSRDGQLLLRFGQDAPPEDRLDNPRGIDAYQQYIYVADTDNNRVVRFETSTSPQQ
ncbi:MAG TPA: hypothetical protein ENO22_05410 [candidate division Zixibacteria bacterium]|nr:hypothetical protein [candidate division Zixibacteria bacterium]HEQ98762.1 hypothetical protein [candidate division Zixibacteria bacterium]